MFKKFFRIHPEGTKFVLIFAVASLIISQFIEEFSYFGLFATLFCAYFFRDPERVSPEGSNLVISPADGTITNIEEISTPDDIISEHKKLIRISIFLSVFNVHVNRIPVSGVVEEIKYVPGLFLNASLDKSSKNNERNYVTVRTNNNEAITFVQIAGLIARRIVCNLVRGQEVEAGKRFGIIRFGSRMDVYLPPKTKIKAAIGQTMIGGETIIAKLI
jgi:phosphatidylserine decarboxylase